MGQALAQPPQFCGSAARSTHLPPHLVVPPAQLSAHLPLTQTRPEGQALAQAPQFCGSAAVSTHLAPHLVVPPLQEKPHLPA